MQTGDNLHEIYQILFSNKKNIFNLLLAEFAYNTCYFLQAINPCPVE